MVNSNLSLVAWQWVQFASDAALDKDDFKKDFSAIHGSLGSDFKKTLSMYMLSLILCNCIVFCQI